jgi:hypothetical protein
MLPSDLTHSHLDAEMQYVIYGAHKKVYQDVDSVRRKDLCIAIGRAVRDVLMERLGDAAAEYSVSEFDEVSVASISGMSETTKEAGSFAVAVATAETCVIYSEGLQRGLKSPYRKEKRSPGSDFDPFSQPGGFCNPMKLKYMDDD